MQSVAVVELFERGFDPRAGGFPDTGWIVEVFRHRGTRDAADGGELFHVADLLVGHVGCPAGTFARAIWWLDASAWRDIAAR